MTERDDELLGAVEVERRGGAPDRLRLTMHPAGRGSVEPALLLAGLVRLRGSRSKLRAEVRVEETAAREAIEAAGFRPLRLLDRLAMRVVSQ